MIENRNMNLCPRMTTVTCCPRLMLVALGVLGGISAQADEESRSKNPTAAFELPEVEVVGITPLPSLGLPLKQVSGNVQSVEDEAIKRQESLNLPRFMNRNLNSVNINDVQNNPYQPDVTYRGFNASPLLGTPIGISVYQDGVRVNEPFGDTVNWDLIPQSAIANLDLLPGSNPLFGLNTLGGALSVRTKSGFSHPGTRAQAFGGSFGRKAFEFEHGGSKDQFDWFITGNIFEQDGWRDHSHSNVHQVFAKVGWENETTDLDLSYTFANNKLTGNGPLPQSLLSANRNSVYTYPDITEPDLNFLNLKASHQFSPDWQLAGNAYYRGNTIGTFNGDVAENCEQFVNFEQCLGETDDDLPHSSVDMPALAGNPENEDSDTLAQNGDEHENGDEHDAEEEHDNADEPAHENQHDQDPSAQVQKQNLVPSAVSRRSRSRQTGTGVQVQLSYLGKVFEKDNKLVFGTSYDYGNTNFNQTEQMAVFTPSRGTLGIADQAPVTYAKAINQYLGIFATDTLSVTPWLHLNASARWNRAEIELSGYGTDEDDGDRTSLAGHHTFNRLNPSAGFTIQPLDALSVKGPLEDLTLYGNYNEGFRVPSPVELTCADPEAPCSLPNSFIADPPLKPVISNTFEVGLRGKFSDALRWSTALYRTELNNDILFTTAPGGTLTRGFFQNVGKTLRQGAEIGLNGTIGSFNWYANYSFVEATYESYATLQNALGPQEVQPGDRIPSIPQQLVKLGAEYELLSGWFLGGDLQYASSQFLRGDDENRLPQVPEYVVVNLHSRYQIHKHVQIFAMANNVFDARYENFGVVNRNFFSGAPNGGTPERFLGPGAPIGGWAGLRVQWD